METLALQPSQVEALRDWQVQNLMALQPLFQRSAENRQALQNALADSAADEVSVGRLLLEGRAIEREIVALRNAQREGAPGALGFSAQQRMKLGELQTALQLSRTAGTAIALNLIEGPAGFPRSGILPTFGAIVPPLPPLPGQPVPDPRGSADEVHEKIGALSAEVAMVTALLARIAAALSIVP